MNLFRVLARPLLASVFIIDSVNALRAPDEHAQKLQPLEATIDKAGETLPALPTNPRTLVRLHASVTLGAGLLFALGKVPRASATVLALAAAPAAIVAYPIRTKAQRKQNLSALVSKAAVIAGLSFAATDRRGAPSLGWRYHNWQSHRAELAQAKVEAAAD